MLLGLFCFRECYNAWELQFHRQGEIPLVPKHSLNSGIDYLTMQRSRWARNLPPSIRKVCLEYVEQRLILWHPSRQQINAQHVLYHFKWFFDFVVMRHPIKTIRSLKREDLQAYMDVLSARGLKPNAIRTRIHRPLALLREMREQGKPIRADLLTIKRPPLADVLPRALSERDAQRVETCARAWLSDDNPKRVCDVACYFLFAHTGIRTCEATVLSSEDVDLIQRRLRIRHGKYDRERIVYLTDTAALVLQRYLEIFPRTGKELMFSDKTGGYLNPWWFLERCLRLGEVAQMQRVTPHRLRHTLATQMINLGVPITTIQKILGHRLLSTTQIYACVYDATVENDYRDAMMRLEKRITDSTPNR